ncbi:four helix bundle protein [Shewanella zhangzhouensis]|uniref:four helix bundle protein n=1 Tax=Shewanella zhangzhouensis TaxID=2864213 RepID=UPI001C66232C|nr:four helix bundle protein [Shewanella zhangzhouensis]QYK03926.1 four helix bundle protein [Shewanella zhangzhouensis]
MKFKSLEVWQLSYQLAITTYRETSGLKDWGFKDQITGCALSIPSNIAEGIERQGPKEQIQFLFIAKGSLAEFITQAMIGRDIGYLNDSTVDDLLDDAQTISAMLGGLIYSISNRCKPKAAKGKPKTASSKS